MTGWDRFIAQFKKDLKQWLFFMLTLSFFRLVLVVYFRSKIEHATPWSDIADAFVNGMRYDGMASTYWMLISFLASALCGFIDLQTTANRARNISGTIFTVLTTVLSVITIIYFKEYNDQFNHFIFNLYYDDRAAIFSTIWAEYHVIPSLMVMSVVSFLLLNVQRRFMQSSWLTRRRQRRRPFPIALRIVYGVVVTGLITIGMRGSYGHRPIKLEDAAVTRDTFLNKAVLNPYSALMYAYGAHERVSYDKTGLETYLPDRDVRKAAQEVFNIRVSLDNLDDYLRKTAPGHRNKTPRHIFLVIMESYDAWPLMGKYTSLGLTHELAALARSGIHVVNFLPASDGTALSLNTLISGLPDANVVTNYQKTARTAYPSSIAESFKHLGYRTRFFYGGYLSWQKYGDFVKAQGFDEVYGAAHIGSWASHNEWGVEDKALFDFIVKTVGPAAEEPSFNMIMTTSYHPPYELDVYGMGFPLKQVPDDLAPEFDNSVTLKMLGHLWYSDRCIGDFVRTAEKTFDAPLFAFTGDHYGRKFINTHPDFFEASAVPFILYGKDVLRGVSLPKDAVGSHVDIGPTLLELTAPKGFTYYAVGRNIFGPERNPLGIARGKIISADYLYDVFGNTFHPLPGKPLPKNLPDEKALKLLHNELNGIAWWRIMKGPKLETPQ